MDTVFVADTIRLIDTLIQHDTTIVPIIKSSNWIALKDVFSSFLGFIAGAGLVLLQQWMQRRNESRNACNIKWQKLRMIKIDLDNQIMFIDGLINGIENNSGDPQLKLKWIEKEYLLSYLSDFSDNPYLIDHIICINYLFYKTSAVLDQIISIRELLDAGNRLNNESSKGQLQQQYSDRKKTFSIFIIEAHTSITELLKQLNTFIDSKGEKGFKERYYRGTSPMVR